VYVALRAVINGLKLLSYFVRFGGELLLFPPKTQYGKAAWLQRFCATAIRGLGVRVTVEGEFPKRGAVISNHLSYVDIVLYASLQPCVFCAKAEIERWPVVGWMTTQVGTVMVERGRGGSALRARGGMQKAAEEGLPVVFFPEGTTTDGSHLLPFHSGLLAQALAVGEPITPAYLRYSLEAENGAGILAAQHVAWGDTPLLEHIWRFLGLRGVHAAVRFAPAPLRFANGAEKRKLAAVEARKALLALSGALDVAPAERPALPH
jgi:1-acyl-sn-glycerol-3-phosphate acyltransferase